MNKNTHKYLRAACVCAAFITVLTLVACTKTSGTDSAQGFKLGVLEIKALTDIQNVMGASILISPEKPELMNHVPANFTMTNIIAVILARYENDAIIFDTGLGSQSGGELLNALEKADLTPDDITGIFLTHMHPDHIGGLIHEGKPAFPKATVYIPAEEAAYFLPDDLSDIPEDQRARFSNIADLFAILKAAEIPIVTFPSGSNLETYFGNGAFSFMSERAFGHTPGHTVYKLASKEEELLIWADILHVMDVQLTYPDISAIYDMDPIRAAGERRRLLHYAAENKSIVTGAHVAPEAFFTISKKGDGFTRKGL